ncbi:MAG: hypothetical protein M1826_007668 [Phylliscum demangeonii]|nr:MAG: hypothetical protein M1826_007668 [Phylliscum demangeonii]
MASGHFQGGLSAVELNVVVAGTAAILDSLGADYAIMGGAAVCLLAPDPGRQTFDVDFVLRVDERRISAEALAQTLLTSYSHVFAPVHQPYGMSIPAYKLETAEGTKLVELEIFDPECWPQRPQYDLQTASRLTKIVNGVSVKFFSPAWLFREKIVTHYERQGSAKARADLQDLLGLMPLVAAGQPELNFDGSSDLHDALASLLETRPEWSPTLHTHR